MAAAQPDFIEIGSDDPAASAAFFVAVFGWSFAPAGVHGGGNFTAAGRQIGLHREETPCVVPYIAVEDLDAAVAAVRAAGGRVMGGIADAGPMGRFATCADPRGARFGLHQRP